MLSIPNDTSFIPDLPFNVGSLSEYRTKVQFDWKRLRVFFEGEECLRVKYEIWQRLEKDPLFAKSSVTSSVEDQKKLAALRMKRVLELKLLPEEIKNSSYQKRVRFLLFSESL
jgi:acyl-CoA oxidase